MAFPRLLHPRRGPLGFYAYLRYHYGIDVAAGFALAAVGLWLAYRAPSLGAIETTQATTDMTPAPAGSVALPVPLSRRRARLPSPLTSPMPFLYRFSDPAVCDVAIGGGKGANLAKLTQAGAPVPPGAVYGLAYRLPPPVLPQIAALVTGVASPFTRASPPSKRRCSSSRLRSRCRRGLPTRCAPS